MKKKTYSFLLFLSPHLNWKLVETSHIAKTEAMLFDVLKMLDEVS